MKLKKKALLNGIILLIFTISLITIFILTSNKSYEISYKIDGYNIIEKYDEKYDCYSFTTQIDKQKFNVITTSSKISGKKLINHVDSVKNDSEICIYMKSEKIKTYPDCYKDNKKVAFHLTELKNESSFYKFSEHSSKEQKHDNIEVHSLINKSVAIWSNKGYYFINDEKSQSIELFENEKYYDTNSYKIDNLIIVPNYDEEYSFANYYIINMKTGKTKKWELDLEINYNSYYLGKHDNKIYLVDKKASKEYSLNPKKRKIELVTDKNNNGIIWNNKWDEISMTKLVNEEYFFTEDKLYDYYIENNLLFLSIDRVSEPIQISNNKVNKIVQIDDDTVYYLSGDSLYLYNFKYGEVLMIKYSEWDFNQKNPIYIY